MDNEKKSENDRKDFTAPYTAHHPIPTVKQYREEKGRRKDAALEPAESRSELPTGTTSENKNVSETDDDDQSASEGADDDDKESDVDEVVQDTSEATNSQGDPKAKRKEMKKRKGDRAERVVTDPVTHLPLRIHDFTARELDEITADENFQQPEYARSSTNLDKSKGHDEQLKEDAATGERTHHEMERLFPPPNFEMIGKQLARVNLVSLGVTASVSALVLNLVHFLLDRDGIIEFLKRHNMASDDHKTAIGATVTTLIYAISIAFMCGAVFFIQTWSNNRVNHVWEAGVWDAERKKGKELAHDPSPESTHWLNSVLGSIWPLINPDLFVSLSDTLEDVMQASLPRFVRMISVEDIGQGSEAFRILGVRWLPRGAARQSVTQDGKLQKRNTDLEQSDRTIPGQGEMQNQQDDSKDENESKEKRKEDEQSDENVAEGMEAEEGDFINLEVGIAFKSRFSGHGMRTRSKNPHLYLAFYLPSNIKLPVWVQLRGFVGVLRIRLQLTPDPPFFSICTLTFLGQPKVDLSCFPLMKRGLNIMNLPVISHFVQSSVDAAMAEFVAPKSLTLDLKDMMMGEDFKKDTMAHGMIMVRIKKAYDFKEGDMAMGPFKSGSTDGYVTVGWAKFGKPMWSSRVITADMDPVWEETAFILVTPQELNVKERLRVQLWDSDRMTADDDLGRIEVDLQEIMNSEQSKRKMFHRQDGFRSLKAGEGMPGKLEWSVGYFPKTKLLDEQLTDADPDVNTVEELKKKVYDESQRKLREASKDESDEIEQQKAQDFKARQDQEVIEAPPPKEYSSGILSVVIHQIQGLELETLNKGNDDEKDSPNDEQEQGDDLPSSYCSIILNHQEIYKTRTKPKNSQPFFNAGTERFVPDIRTAHVHIAVRDARVHEDDSLIGIVDLPLSDVFEKRSQVNDMWPLSGGVGFGRIRISMVFRSVELQAPRELLGWELGTLDIDPEIKGDVAEDLKSCNLKVRTNLGSGKLRGSGGSWKSKNEKHIRLPVRQRYSSCMVVEFRSGSTFSDKTPAFAILWLKDIADDEEKTLSLPVWKGDLKKARVNVWEECGEKAGTIEIKVKFWQGLSGYHLPLAKKDKNIESVMEVLDCAADADDNEMMDEDSASSDSDSDANPAKSVEKTGKHYKNKFAESSDSLEGDGKRGPIDEVKDYGKHRKQLHRRNRGLMQWKAPRTLKWMKHKLDHGQEKIARQFNHHQTNVGVETEA